MKKLALCILLFSCARNQDLGERGDAGIQDTTSADIEEQPDVAVVDSSKKSVLRMFVIDSEFQGDFAQGKADAAAEADRICQTYADSEELQGRWRAWLSTSTSFAHERLKGDGPWRSLSETHGDAILFRNRAQFERGPDGDFWTRVDGSRPISEFKLWTGTEANGDLGNTCQDWTSKEEEETGLVGSSYGEELPLWTDQANAPCRFVGGLYCFESDE